MKRAGAGGKYCYDVDILPTISNLLGLEYDSRLMVGQDILSDSEQLVCFPESQLHFREMHLQCGQWFGNAADR